MANIRKVDLNLLVVLDEAVLDDVEDGLKNIWIFDVRDPANPIPVATMPVPNDADYPSKGAHYGPHNIHENRPGTFVSSELIFATYQNAGIRVFDIRDPRNPKEAAYYVPAAPAGSPKHEIQINDVYVDDRGLIFACDRFTGGLYIITSDALKN